MLSLVNATAKVGWWIERRLNTEWLPGGTTSARSRAKTLATPAS